MALLIGASMGTRHCRNVISEGRKNLPTTLRESRWIRASVILSLARDAASPKANHNTSGCSEGDLDSASKSWPSFASAPAQGCRRGLPRGRRSSRDSLEATGRQRRPRWRRARRSRARAATRTARTRATSRRRPDPCRSCRRAGRASPDEGNIDRGHAIEPCSDGGMICP